jgi:hypothetical protein
MVPNTIALENPVILRANMRIDIMEIIIKVMIVIVKKR